MSESELEHIEELLSTCRCAHRLPSGGAPDPVPDDDECYAIECMACARVLCPKHCELHTHHDGCVCEADDE
jgi:hypothetical protein